MGRNFRIDLEGGKTSYSKINMFQLLEVILDRAEILDCFGRQKGKI